MRAAPRPEPVREAQEVGLVDRVQHLDRRALDDLSSSVGMPSGRCRPVGLGDVRPLDRLRSIRPALQPSGQVREVCLGPPRSAPTSRRRSPGRRLASARSTSPGDARHSRHGAGAPSTALACPAQPLHVPVPAHSARLSRLSVRGAFCRRGFPLARPLPSIASAAVCPSVVRGLRRYYGPVRLPVPVHHRRMSLDFPMRPAAPSATGEPGRSRLSREVCPDMRGVSDRAGLRRVSPWRRAGCGLPPSSTASASRSRVAFAAVYPACPIPLSTLRSHPRGDHA